LQDFEKREGERGKAKHQAKSKSDFFGRPVAKKDLLSPEVRRDRRHGGLCQDQSFLAQAEKDAATLPLARIMK
jgi:hypothetical protein